MPTNIEVPSLGESITEAVLLRWLKNEGDYVAADEPLAELETDKANVDLPAKTAGVLRQAKKPGETVKVGETIARIEEAPAGAPKPAASAPKAAEAAAKATVSPAKTQTQSSEDLRPSVRRLVEENKLDASTIPGTGPGGRIIKEDVLNKLKPGEQPAGGNGASAPVAPPVAKTPSATRPAPPPPPAARPFGDTGEGEFDAKGVKRVVMTKIRKRIAERLVSAQQTAAILTTFNEVDMSGIMALRAKYKDRFQEVYGVGAGLHELLRPRRGDGLARVPPRQCFYRGRRSCLS